MASTLQDNHVSTGKAATHNNSYNLQKINSVDDNSIGSGNDTDRPIDPPNGQLSKDIITEDMVRLKAFRWCRDSIGGVWQQLESEKELCISPISGGMSNYLYLIALPESVSPLRTEPRQVLLRIYGQISKSTLDFLVHNSVVFALLAERRLGPKPFGMYHDGRIEEFIQAKPLQPLDLRKPEVMDMVAEKLAQFHGLDMPLCKKPRFFKSLVRGWIKDIQNNVELNEDTLAKLLKMMPSFDLEKEFTELLAIASRLKCPIVFCHNDLQGGNVLLAEKDSPTVPRMTIIDWEYAHYNFRGFDLGNHFNEWTFDYSSSGRPGFECIASNYPGKELQYQFFRSYLLASGKEEVTEADLVAMYKETNTLALHSHFLWGVWAMVQAQTSSIEFDYSPSVPPIDYSAYALSRFEGYFNMKRKLPEMLREASS